MQYVILFFPPQSMRRFKARRCYKDRVLMPTICCLHKCVNLEELYLEKADSSGITSYLLAHILKFLIRLRVLALPKQCDDDVASVIGLNCPKLECIILTGTSVTNVGLSWMLCCRQLHTVIMPGFLQGNILFKILHGDASHASKTSLLKETLTNLMGVLVNFLILCSSFDLKSY